MDSYRCYCDVALACARGYGSPRLVALLGRLQVRAIRQTVHTAQEATMRYILVSHPFETYIMAGKFIMQHSSMTLADCRAFINGQPRPLSADLRLYLELKGFEFRRVSVSFASRPDVG